MTPRDESARGPETTTDDVLQGVDLSGRTAVVTGASSGIGAETARALAAVGARVILAVRDVEAGRSVAAGIGQRHPGAQTDVRVLDLADLASVRAFAAGITADTDRLDVLINNAGVMGTGFHRTADGFEMQFGTNHLGHFLLTNLLRPVLAASRHARVVNVSSAGHTLSDIIWDDPNYLERPYDKWESYGQSKTANILFTLELDGRVAATGGHSYAVHPGMIGTNLARYLEPGDFKALMSRGARSGATAADGPAAPLEKPIQKAPAVAMKSIPAGAATSVWAATEPALADHGGAYLEDCHLGVAAEHARDARSAQRLWAMSETMVGQSFP